MTTKHALSDLSRADAQVAALHCAAIDHATEIAEKAGTSVIVPADTMRAVLDYVERLVAFYNENTTPPASDTPDDRETFHELYMKEHRRFSGNDQEDTP